MRMKKTIILLLTFIILTAFGNKKEEQAQKDDLLIQKFLKQHPDIQAEKDSSGLYFEIITKGDGEYPKRFSYISVQYEGYLLNGNLVDSGSIETGMIETIKGWQIGLRKIQEGGKIKLIIPSGLAYGKEELDSVPRNSNLMFDIELKKIY